ncbi:MAG: DUF2306 domain-containing protein [Dokdonella sp.]
MTHPLDAATRAAVSPAGQWSGHQPPAGLLSIAAMPQRSASLHWSLNALNAAATSWFFVAVLGQLMLVVFVIGFYGRAAAQGHFETWNKVLPHGYVVGDTVGNLIVSMHLIFATLIIIGGALQLTTGVRRLFPTFHRWNGRAYLVSAFVMSLGGLAMIATRGAVGGSGQTLAIVINAVLVMAFAGMTLRHALARRFDLHRQWALRLFLVVSGVWFFRIGLMFWILVNRGPVGFDPHTFRGPALTIIAFTQYLLPLFVLELYFRAQRSIEPRMHVAMTASLFVLTLATAVGIFAASMMLWLPRL